MTKCEVPEGWTLVEGACFRFIVTRTYHSPSTALGPSRLRSVLAMVAERSRGLFLLGTARCPSEVEGRFPRICHANPCQNSNCEAQSADLCYRTLDLDENQ